VRYAGNQLSRKALLPSTSAWRNRRQCYQWWDYPELIHNRCLRLIELKRSYQLADNGVRDLDYLEVHLYTFIRSKAQSEPKPKILVMKLSEKYDL
jgi:hypothetical protein